MNHNHLLSCFIARWQYHQIWSGDTQLGHMVQFQANVLDMPVVQRNWTGTTEDIIFIF